MSNPTSNFGWQMPTATDLVTDLPADFEVFGQAVDTDFADLNGGTTGQILSKTSATDLDFTWINNDQGDITEVTATSPITGGGSSGNISVGIQDALTTQKGAVQLSDSTSTTSSILAATPTAVKSAYDLANGAIPKTLTTTTGDSIYASAANTPARLGIGSTGQVLTVAGGIPSWATPSSGSMTLLSTTALTSTSITVSSISGSYTNLFCYIKDAYINATPADIRIRLNGLSGASSYVSLGSNNSYIFIGTPSSSGTNPLQAAFTIFRYSTADARKFVTNNSTISGNYQVTNGNVDTTGAINQIQVLISSSTFTAGSFLIYGVN